MVGWDAGLEESCWDEWEGGRMCVLVDCGYVEFVVVGVRSALRSGGAAEA